MLSQKLTEQFKLWKDITAPDIVRSIFNKGFHALYKYNLRSIFKLILLTGLQGAFRKILRYCFTILS